MENLYDDLKDTDLMSNFFVHQIGSVEWQVLFPALPFPNQERSAAGAMGGAAHSIRGGHGHGQAGEGGWMPAADLRSYAA